MGNGFLFICTDHTQAECFERKLFGDTGRCQEEVLKIRRGDFPGFLYNISSRKLFGVFEAISDGGYNLVPGLLYWVACFVFGFLGLLLVLVIGSFLFPEAQLFRSLFSIIAVSFGILLGAYLASRVWKRRFETRTLRMVYVAGGVVLGMFAWSFILIPLALVFDIPAEGVIVILLLFILMAIGAVIMDAIGKRRDYRPLMEGGNIK